MTASVLLINVANLYGTCRAYSDEGVVRSTSLDGGESVDAGTFRTSFKRPDTFTFEWLDSTSQRLNLELVEGRALVRSSEGWTDEHKTLEAGICSLLGVTRGAVCIIPSLLFPNMEGMVKISDIMDARFGLSDEPGLEKIEGTTPKSNCQIWLKKGENKVLKCRLSTQISAEQQRLMFKQVAALYQEKGVQLPDATDSSFIDEVLYSQVDLRVDS